MDKVDGDEEMKQDLSFFANKNLPQNQQFDPGRNSKYEPILGRQAPTNLKKARGEVGFIIFVYVYYLYSVLCLCLCRRRIKDSCYMPEASWAVVWAIRRQIRTERLPGVTLLLNPKMQ